MATSDVGEVQASTRPKPAVGDAIATVRRGVTDGAVRDVASRVDQLERLRSLVVDHERELQQALRHDVGLSDHDGLTSEILPVVRQIDHALDRIGSWARTRRYGLPLGLRPGSATSHHTPKGVVAVIAPASSPVQQLLVPAATALAAGNTVVLKPSITSNATATVLSELLGERTEPAAVQLVTSDRSGATELLGRGVDHVVIGGSRSTADVVRHHAAGRSIGCTAIAGTKNPAIVTPSADVPESARRLALGKFARAGQSCEAPDYALVHRSLHRELTDAIATAIEAFYGDDVATSPEYSRIASTTHIDRLAGLLEGGGYQAVASGGRIDRAMGFLEPTVLAGVRHDAPVMRDEIFGPILPVLVYESLDDAIAFVAQRPRPLIGFVFGRRPDEIDRVVAGTTSGSVVVNHTISPGTVRDLPLDGRNPDRGIDGFRAMSHLRPIVRRNARVDAPWQYPPTSASKRRALRRLF